MRPPTHRSSTARIPRRISLPWRRSAPISGAYPTASSYRAAGVIGASGIIVWLRDGSGQRLRAVTSHGYSAQTLGKMGDLPCDGDNAAATAFRTARMQVAERQGHGNSAVVAPLIAAEGCVGVMTAELPENATSQTRALASIVAAQLVVLLGGNAETDAAEPEAAAVDVKRGTA